VNEYEVSEEEERTGDLDPEIDRQERASEAAAVLRDANIIGLKVLCSY